MNTYIRRVNGVIIEHTINGVPQPLPVAAIADRGPSFAQKARNLAGAGGRVVRAKLRGEKATVSRKEKNRRLEICRSCEHFTGRSCNLCGCVAKWKTKLATESCPDIPPRW